LRPHDPDRARHADPTSGTLNQAGGTGTLAGAGRHQHRAAYTGGTPPAHQTARCPDLERIVEPAAADTLNVVNINDPASTLTISASLRTTRNWTFTASGGLTASASSIIFAGGHDHRLAHAGGGRSGRAVTMCGRHDPDRARPTLTLTSGTLNRLAPPARWRRRRHQHRGRLHRWPPPPCSSTHGAPDLERIVEPAAPIP